MTPVFGGRLCKSGVLAGYECVDFKVTLLDGSYHDVDSSEMAYQDRRFYGIQGGCPQGGSRTA